MTAVFAIYQDVVSVEDIRSIRKSLKQAQNEISAQRAKSIIGVAGAVAITVASAGAAFVFAPLIAPIIAGEAVAGLSGAALTSASLAFVGGGALAAGGAGMAGGTAIIAGGGALLGAAGGSSASALASLTSGGDGYVFAEASKLVCFCREVLLERYNDIDAVTSIQKQLNEKIFSYEIELESLKQGGAIPVIINETDSGNKSKRKQDEKELNPKKQQKILEKSLKYLKRCNDALSKSLRKQK
jgi:hypothetical protein